MFDVRNLASLLALRAPRRGAAVMAFAGAMFLAACGDEAPGGGASSGGGTTPNLGPVISVVILDDSGAQVTELSPGQKATGQATLSRRGQPLANEIVTFSVGSGELATLSPTTGAILTDGTGTAKISLIASSAAAGATTLSASATVNLQSAVASTNFSVAQVGSSGARIASFAVTAPSGGLSAYGSAPMSVTVTDASGAPPSQPVTVNFTSSCPPDKATITASATTQPNGVAQGTFTDAGCASAAAADVTIRASVGAESRSQTLRINASTSGSLRFDSADPAGQSITLKGQGGVGRQEFATLVFRLVDVAGNGVADIDVCFDATTYVGGLNLDGFNDVTPPPALGSVDLCGSDNVLRYVKRTGADGSVRVQINSGTTPTPVRVRARALYPVVGGNRLQTISDSLSISTGLPLQRSFDLSLSSSNIEGRDISGTTTRLTARLADQFGNPVPDGTVVNFISSGGAVCTSTTGSCTTANGECSCQFRSQEFRPADGRVVVLAYTVGLEDYVDTNGNNVYDVGEPFTDLPDAYVDADKSGTYSDAADVCLRFQNPNQCARAGDNIRGAAHLRRSALILLSGTNTPTVIIPAAYNAGGYVSIPASSCPAGSPVIPLNLPVQLEDGVGNATAAGTSVAVAAESELISASVDPGAVPNLVLGVDPARDSSNAPKTTTNLSNPTLIGTIHRIRLTPVANSALPGTCSVGASGVLIKVTSPSGLLVNARILFEGEPRSAARGVLPVVVK